LLALVPDAPFMDTSFEGLVDKVTGAVDSVTSTVSLLKAKPAQLAFHVKNLQSSLQRARSVLVYPAREQAEKLAWAVQGMLHGETKTSFAGGQQVITPIVAPGRRVQRFQTKTRSTLAEIAILLAMQGHKNSANQLRELNPGLIAKPEVAAGATVRFYE
jgi:hypothetical protein